MSVEAIVGAWLWNKYGIDLANALADKAKDQLTSKAKEQWTRFEWTQAAEKYRQRVKDLYSTTRMLGRSEPVSLEDIFTDVYLLDRPTALQRFDIEALKAQHAERGFFRDEGKRASALRLALEKDHLFILGKPGAGKTTFLKYLTLQAATGKLDRVPIFISLNEWANSKLDLLPFIERQFDICAFPDALAFIKHLLQRGEAVICFDGLDEVNEADDKRSAISRAIVDFTNQYSANKHLITCRIAATDYAFEKFTYVEMADLTPEQVKVFARKWFTPDETKAQRFSAELERGEHRGLRELAQTPLLLTLLCLNFAETLTFPARRAELYEEALDALLKKWDASRNIKRDEMYRGLSLGRKRQLFARVAAEYFERGEIFFRQNDLAQRISAYLKQLPGSEAAAEADGEAVVKAVEAQHGLFVERANRVYSFSHLTLQEYFTARYLVDHAADGALERLLQHHLIDDRWREVFLLVASLLPEADSFFSSFQHAVDNLLNSDEHLLDYGRWVSIKAKDYADLGHIVVARAASRAFARNLTLDFTSTLDFDLTRNLTFDFTSILDFNPALDFNPTPDFDLARDLAISLGFIRDHALTRDMARDLAHAGNRVRVLALAIARAHVLVLALANDRALDLANDFELTCALDRVRIRDLTPALDLTTTLGHDLTLDLTPALNLDRIFIFAWLFAKLRYRQGTNQLIDDLIHSSQRLGLDELAQALRGLRLPPEDASNVEWQRFVDELQALMIRERNIGQTWSFTEEQLKRLEQYEQVTILLAECLQLAAVSDRQAIENRLLLPPS